MSSLENSSFIPLPVLNNAPEMWRSLDEWRQDPVYQEAAKQEFHEKAELWSEPISRRDFLKFMGATFGAAFISGCRRPLEKIIPYNQPPENIIPGKPLYYTSALPINGYGRGVLVETHMGRPTKVEGHPKHPDSLGASDIFMQASVRDLYDPDRSETIVETDLIRNWDDFLKAAKTLRASLEATRGDGLRVILENTTSPSLLEMLEQFKRRYPKARVIVYDSADSGQQHTAMRQAFGRNVHPVYDFSKADVIAAFDADFMSSSPGHLRAVHDFSQRRRPNEDSNRMNRLYVAEPTPSLAGAMADHHIALSYRQVEAALDFLASKLGVSGSASASGLPAAAQQWLTHLAKDLSSKNGRTLVLAGNAQTPRAQILAHAINRRLGNVGETVRYVESFDAASNKTNGTIAELVDEMRNGRIQALIILGSNPVYSLPPSSGFSDAMAKVAFRLHSGLYADETAALCQWHIPQAHPLESWDDIRAFDGTASIVQPMIDPLYGGKTAQEILSVFTDEAPRKSHDIVQGFWKKRFGVNEAAWDKALHDGIIPGTTAANVSVSLLASALSVKPWRKSASDSRFEVLLRPDPTILDGRYSNNSWLQECPKPHSKVVWDNAAYLSPSAAQRLGVKQNDVIEIQSEGQNVRAPVWVLPRQASQTITLHLGYGRGRSGKLGSNQGFPAEKIRQINAWDILDEANVEKTHKTYSLVSTQTHFNMEGRELVRSATLAQYQRHPDFAKRPHENPSKEESLYSYNLPKASDDYAWGMSIDLNQCIGCNACLIACQAENNIPAVGKEQVAVGREMHWIRIDQYYEGDPEHPESHHQPVTCMHCENAPCEVVCPVGATVHSDEGINEMVYNRCIGTKYCSNNCPYKVRRFNFLNYNKETTGSLELLQNPNVTVRSRGVMEKCTFCIQRINAARIQSEKEGRLIRDGEFEPACMQACPSNTIDFGNLKDPKSHISQTKKNPRSYGLLTELNTRPRTDYLARVRNPNPDMVEGV